MTSTDTRRDKSDSANGMIPAGVVAFVLLFKPEQPVYAVRISRCHSRRLIRNAYAQSLKPPVNPADLVMQWLS